MSMKRLAKITVFCAIAVALVSVITIVPLTATPEPMLRTADCQGHTASSLTANGDVRRVGDGVVIRRGFVFTEGPSPDPVLEAIRLVNASFESGDPPYGWVPHNVTLASESGIVVVGTRSLKLTSHGTWGRVMQSLSYPSQYWNKSVTLGVWAKAPSTNGLQQVIVIRDKLDGDWDNSYSHTIPKSDTWHWITASRTIRDQATDIEILLFVNHTGTEDHEDVVYWDGAVLAQNAVFEDGGFGTGDYSLIIRGLKPDTSYRVTAFVVDAAGVRYGNTLTCRTAQ